MKGLSAAELAYLDQLAAVYLTSLTSPVESEEEALLDRAHRLVAERLGVDPVEHVKELLTWRSLRREARPEVFRLAEALFDVLVTDPEAWLSESIWDDAEVSREDYLAGHVFSAIARCSPLGIWSPEGYARPVAERLSAVERLSAELLSLLVSDGVSLRSLKEEELRTRVETAVRLAVDTPPEEEG